jgi:hypothetical protein
LLFAVLQDGKGMAQRVSTLSFIRHARSGRIARQQCIVKSKGPVNKKPARGGLVEEARDR